ncbi:hypothetical protein BS78_05G271500 [Paspalum vaginatum]|nr:hypothetical protein BS78_05G271500 [Paspalum vaginatum]KAJ1277137.1 hypothetical protein BS78_05G271500 [Paspalum vaginatum]
MALHPGSRSAWALSTASAGAASDRGAAGRRGPRWGRLQHSEVEVASARWLGVSLCVLRRCGHSAPPSSSGAVATVHGMARRVELLAGAVGIKTTTRSQRRLLFRSSGSPWWIWGLKAPSLLSLSPSPPFAQGAGAEGSGHRKGADGRIPIFFLLHKLAA